MKVTQVLNNNAVLAKRGGHEVIALAKGIGVRKKKGQELIEGEVERIYIPDSYDILDHFSYLLSHSDAENILLVQRIISHAEAELSIEVADSLALTLLDHIDYVLKRAENHQFIKSPLYWDIRRFYPQYFKVGLDAIEMIRARKGVELPDSEAASIAVHFINMQEMRQNKGSVVKGIRALGDIVSIVEMQFGVKLEQDSASYARFIMHLQYFIQRVSESHAEEGGSAGKDLYSQVAQLYPQAFKAVQKIKAYVRSQFDVAVDIDEETYLMLHIHRVTERMEKGK